MAMVKIEIEIEDLLSEVCEEGGNFNEALRQEIVSGIVNKCTKNIDKDIIGVAEKKIKEFDAKIADEVVRAIDNQIASILDGFINRKINIYDKWGDVQRENVAIVDLMKEKMDLFLTEQVDEKGEAGGYGANKSRLEYIMQQNITYEMKRRIDNAATEIRKKLEKHMQEELQKSIGEKMVDLLKLDKCMAK